MTWSARAADLLDPPPPCSQESVFRRLGYEPHARQWLFHRAQEWDVLYGGSSGGGKTRAIVMHVLWAAVAYPGIRIGVFRRTFDELNESVIPELAKVDFGSAIGGRYDKTSHEVTVGRSTIRLRYLETLQDATRRQGGEYALVCFEERTLLPPGTADLVVERLRTARDRGIPVLGVRSTSNPGGMSHAEVKRRYIDATNHGQKVTADEHGHTIAFIPARATDNRHLGPEYHRVLDAIPDPARRAAMRDGSWDSFAGQVFGEWRHDRHVVQPFPLPDAWDRYCGIDWGYTAPWAALWLARDEDGRIWVYRELYAAGVGEHEQARRILEAEAHEPASWKVIDPAVGARRGDAESILSAYEGEGCMVELANNNRLAGWQRLHDYLGDAAACPHHRALGWVTCPRLHVFAPVANLIRTLPTLTYSPIRVEDVETRSEDHAADAVRYALMSVGGAPRYHFGGDDAEDWESAAAGATVPDEPQRFRALGPFALPDDAPAPWS